MQESGVVTGPTVIAMLPIKLLFDEKPPFSSWRERSGSNKENANVERANGC
jgi:hypothetical protein